MNCEVARGNPTPESLDLPARQGLSKVLARVLGLDAAERYYRTLPLSAGLAASADQILFDRGFDVAAVRATASSIPERGALLITANHPTGIFDGVLILSALLARRQDVRVVANEVLCRIPVLAERVLSIKKGTLTNSRNLKTLLAIRHSWKNEECVVVFPAGTVEHWQWQEMRVKDAPWTHTVQHLATRLNIPEHRATISLKNPLWFHAIAALSRTARTALLIRAFFATPKNIRPCPIAFATAR